MRDFQNMIWSPEAYEAAAFLAQAAGEEMLARLDLMAVQPAVMVDAGCGMGELAAGLLAKYPAATVYAVDLSAEMLSRVGEGVVCRQEDAANLSLPDQSVDLICANFLLPWAADANACLREFRRILKPNGLLMVSVLGMNTMRELQSVISADVMPRLIDMHDAGDALITAGFIEPVMDTAIIPVRYRDHQRMQDELHAAGLLHPSVTLPAAEYTVTFEVVHGHAFAPQAAGFKADADGVVRIPLRHLRTTSGY